MKKILSWVAVILWMIIIFTFSSQVAEQSGGLSTEITEIILKAIEKIAPKADFDIGVVNLILRKSAHFFIYLVLGILVMNALRRSGIKGYRSIAIAAVICILYAASDEIHQLYVPGRAGQLKDVLLDSAGSWVGIIVYYALSNKGEKNKS